MLTFFCNYPLSFELEHQSEPEHEFITLIYPQKSIGNSYRRTRHVISSSDSVSQ